MSDEESYLAAHEKVASGVVSRLCTLMGVRLVRVRREFDWEEALPEGAHVHPNLFLAFSQTTRCVYYAEPKRTVLLYLPHEVIHVVWPTVPWDPEIEWLEGLLPYEMAWLDRLCRTSTERECFKCWSRYADEGRDAVADFDSVLGEARHMVAYCNLPDPWDQG